jgi:hypothetical protein
MDCAERITALANPQHTYRRGHIFWWRRVHRLFDSTVIDVRLSLRTGSRADARDRGAALTAATHDVVDLMNERAIKAIDASPTEDELRQIARAAYGERLGRICDEQRAQPHGAPMLSFRNRSYADYFERLRKNGGRIEMIEGEEQALHYGGWDDQRIGTLRSMTEEALAGTPMIYHRDVDFYLREPGFQPHNAYAILSSALSIPLFGMPIVKQISVCKIATTKDRCLAKHRRIGTMIRIPSAEQSRLRAPLSRLVRQHRKPCQCPESG